MMMMMITRKNLENEEEVNKTNTQIDKEANRNINAISVQIKRITTTTTTTTSTSTSNTTAATNLCIWIYSCCIQTRRSRSFFLHTRFLLFLLTFLTQLTPHIKWLIVGLNILSWIVFCLCVVLAIGQSDRQLNLSLHVRMNMCREKRYIRMTIGYCNAAFSTF